MARQKKLKNVQKYKVLIHKISGEYAIIEEDSIYPCNAPILLPYHITMDVLKKFYTKINLKDYILKTANVEIL